MRPTCLQWYCEQLSILCQNIPHANRYVYFLMITCLCLAFNYLCPTVMIHFRHVSDLVQDGSGSMSLGVAIYLSTSCISSLDQITD